MRLIKLTVDQLRLDFARGSTLDSRHFLGRTLMCMGELYSEEADAEQAIPILEEGLTYIDKDYLSWGPYWVMGRIAYLRSLTDNFREAEQWLLKSIELSEACETVLVYALHRLSYLEQTRGNYGQSCTFALQGLTIARSLGRPNRTASVLNNLAESEYRLGDFDNAAIHRQEALAIWRALGNRQGAAQARHGLGRIAWIGAGNREEASAHFQEALAYYQSIGNEAESRACLADIALLNGEGLRDQ